LSFWSRPREMIDVGSRMGGNVGKVARWVPPLVFGGLWTALGVVTQVWPEPWHWWAVVAPTALPAVAGLLVVLAWTLRSWWLAVVAGLLVVLPSAPWNLDWFSPSTSFTTLHGYEMSRADELKPLFLLETTSSTTVLLPGLLLLAAALFGFLVTGTQGWTPLLGTGLGVLAFAVSDLVDRLTTVRLGSITWYGASYERQPPALPSYGVADWPDLTSAAITCALLVWALVRRDQVVAMTAVVFGGVERVVNPSAESRGAQFLDADHYDHWKGFWEGVPDALAPACVLLSGAAVAHLLHERGTGPSGSPVGPAFLPGV
jgi:hypothetical protein